MQADGSSVVGFGNGGTVRDEIYNNKWQYSGAQGGLLGNVYIIKWSENMPCCQEWIVEEIRVFDNCLLVS